MIRYAPKRLYAALLLLVLLAAYAGQKVHIYNEDHAHFSAHCGDLVPDNGAHTIIVDRCIIDDFYFFPYLDIAPTVHSFYACLLYTSAWPAGSSRHAPRRPPSSINDRAQPPCRPLCFP